MCVCEREREISVRWLDECTDSDIKSNGQYMCCSGHSPTE